EPIDVAIKDAIEHVLARFGVEFFPGSSAKGRGGGNGTRAGTAQQRQGPPEIESLTQFIASAGVHNFGAVVEDIVEEVFPPAAQRIGNLFRPTTGKDVALMPLGDVRPPSLDKMVREALTKAFALLPRCLGQALEVRC